MDQWGPSREVEKAKPTSRAAQRALAINEALAHTQTLEMLERELESLFGHEIPIVGKIRRALTDAIHFERLLLSFIGKPYAHVDPPK